MNQRQREALTNPLEDAQADIRRRRRVHRIHHNRLLVVILTVDR